MPTTSSRRPVARIRQWAAVVWARLVRARRRKALRAMLYRDERPLLDIGLTQADIVNCLSAPWNDPVEVLDQRPGRNHARPVLRDIDIERLAA